MVTRKIDELGRITIPREILKNLNWNLKAEEPGTELEFVVNGKEVLLRKYGCKCNCCSNDPVTEVQGIKLCNECIEKFYTAMQILNNAKRLLNKIKA